jgi:hypothetical protein
LKQADNHNVAAHHERIHGSSDALAASDVEHMVNSRTVREGVHGHMPLWVASVVDHCVSAKLFGTR